MAKRIQLVGHLDAAELFERYRVAADQVVRSQVQIIWLLTSGKSLAEVAAASGYSTRWIQKLIHRYNTGGAAAWAFDAHRLGLKPITRRLWARKGQRPIARVNHRYQWLYLYGFLEFSSGEVVWYLFNTVNIEAFQKTLEARERGADTDKIIILVLDNAGWHTTEKIKPPEGLILLFLPPDTPELQPAERRWPLANEAVVNTSFPPWPTIWPTSCGRWLCRRRSSTGH